MPRLYQRRTQEPFPGDRRLNSHSPPSDHQTTDCQPQKFRRLSLINHRWYIRVWISAYLFWRSLGGMHRQAIVVCSRSLFVGPPPLAVPAASPSAIGLGKTPEIAEGLAAGIASGGGPTKRLREQ